MDWYRVKNSSTIYSPALLVYKVKLTENIARAVSIAGNAARLRPHVKTHKIKQITELQMRAGITRFKCATIAEAEMLAQCGVKDIVLAYQMVGPNIARFTELCKAYRDVSFKALVDSENALKMLADSLSRSGLKAEALLDLDIGMHRTGIAPGDRAFQLYKLLVALDGVLPGGIHGYDGHNHQRDLVERTSAAESCYAQVVDLKQRLEKAGLPVPRLIMGGTPLFPCYARFPDVELSPGTCFLYDGGYQALLPDLPFQPAALLLSRVVSVPAPGLITLDAGTKAIASDPKDERGAILDFKETRTVLHNEEHWTLEVRGSQNLRVGDELYVLPTHICPTFALHRTVYVVGESGEWEESWPVAARDRRITV